MSEFNIRDYEYIADSLDRWSETSKDDVFSALKEIYQQGFEDGKREAEKKFEHPYQTGYADAQLHDNIQLEEAHKRVKQINDMFLRWVTYAKDAWSKMKACPHCKEYFDKDGYLKENPKEQE